MSKLTKRTEVPIPLFMANLPVTSKGYLKPWFVKEDDFRVVDGDKAWLPILKKACWICGNPFKPNEFALVGDARCVELRIYTEPPCHVECAEYSAQVCPFMLYPNAQRREAGLSEDATLDARNKDKEVHIAKENPGEYYIVVVRDFEFDRDLQILKFKEEDVIEKQRWVGGIRQETLPEHIYQADQLPK